MGLMKQAAELKSKMEAMQAELEAAEIEGSAGGDLVAVKLNGKSEMRGVRIDDSLLKPTDKEVLEDLLIAAHADARRKVEALTQDKMKNVAGGLPLPRGLKLF
jgi:DNA-binding YbaB/EbfC family protein